MLVVTQGSYAGSIEYIADLNGPSEFPPGSSTSTGTGIAEVNFDIVAHTMHVEVFFNGLEGLTTASHIHAPTSSPFTGAAGIATQLPTFPGFPLGVTSGFYDHTFDTLDPATYNPAFESANGGTAAGAEAALAADLANGTAYLNIHTTKFPGGEISGFFKVVPNVVPEPQSIVMLGIGALGVIACGCRRAWR
jgi:hypothetical protein